MNILTLFRKAGATGNVFLLKRGKQKDMGLAYSGFISPMTTVAVVPTTPQIVSFAVEAKTSDKQDVTVVGSITATLVPRTAVSRFDFTVDPKNGAYLSPWQQTLQAKVIEKALRAILNKVKDLAVEDATRAQKIVEDEVTQALGKDNLAQDGIVIDSCSIPKIEADDEVAEALGAKERQAMLADADKALHERRLNASQNDRTIKQFEADTRLGLEQKNGALIEEQGRNKEKEASADAKATEIRLAPLKDVEPGKLLGAALMEMAKGGRIGNLSIVPEMLTALGAQKG